MTAIETGPDRAAGIRPPRSRREPAPSRRRGIVSFLTAIGVALSGAGIFSLNPVTRTDVLHAAAVEARSLADLIGQRSPGQRTEARLTKRAASLDFAKALPSTTRRRSPKPAIEELASFLLTQPSQVSPDTMSAAIFTPSSAHTLEAAILPSAAGGRAGAPASGPGPGGGGSATSQPGGGKAEGMPAERLVPVASAVPEPATWALMLIGFGLIGWLARRAGKASPPCGPRDERVTC